MAPGSRPYRGPRLTPRQTRSHLSNTPDPTNPQGESRGSPMHNYQRLARPTCPRLDPDCPARQTNWPQTGRTLHEPQTGPTAVPQTGPRQAPQRCPRLALHRLDADCANAGPIPATEWGPSSRQSLKGYRRGWPCAGWGPQPLIHTCRIGPLQSMPSRQISFPSRRMVVWRMGWIRQSSSGPRH